MKDTFELKAVVTVKATPEEILSTLKDHSVRRVWDIGVSQASKANENEIIIKYDGGYTENVQISTFGERAQPQGPHFIQEHVNG